MTDMKHIFRGFFLLLLALAGCVAPKTTRSDWKEQQSWIPLLARETSAPIVEIGGSQKGKTAFLGIRVKCRREDLLMALDTGSTVTVLRESLIDSFRHKPLQTAEVQEIEGNKREQELFETSELFVEETRLRNEVIAFLPDSMFDKVFSSNGGQKVDGILGSNLLHRGEIEINTVEKKLIMRPFMQGIVSTLPVRFPMVWESSLNQVILPVEVGTDKNCRFILDTGLRVNLVFDSEGTKGKTIAAAAPSLGSIPCNTVHGSYPIDCYRLPFPVVAGAVKYDTGSQVCVEKRSDHRFEGSIGMPLIWAHKRVAMNKQQEVIGFEKY